MNKERLLNVAKALRESPNPSKFTMGNVTHPCGTPACAIGHYIARQDLQQTFLPVSKLSKYMDGSGTCFLLIHGKAFDWESREVRKHFDITAEQFEELFGPWGSGEARTANAAAEYIERFVAEH